MMPIQLYSDDPSEVEYPLPEPQDDDFDTVTVTAELDDMPFARFQAGRGSLFF